MPCMTRQSQLCYSPKVRSFKNKIIFCFIWTFYFSLFPYWAGKKWASFYFTNVSLYVYTKISMMWRCLKSESALTLLNIWFVATFNRNLSRLDQCATQTTVRDWHLKRATPGCRHSIQQMSAFGWERPSWQNGRWSMSYFSLGPEDLVLNPG